MNRTENQTCSVSAQVSIGNEASEEGEQKVCSHEVSESVGSCGQIEVHRSQEVENHAHHVCNKPHVIQCQQRCSEEQDAIYESETNMHNKLTELNDFRLFVFLVAYRK